MTDIDKKQVEDFFSTAASVHKNENAVLDVAVGQEHANIYRNYFTKKYLLKNIAPEKSETILDFGCGVGRITKLLANKSLRVIGVDSNNLMIEIANQKFDGGNNISYQKLENEKIQSDENYFDTVFSHWVFQHINDDESVQWLNEIKRVLKPGGRILLFEQVTSKTISSAKHLLRSTEHYQSLFNKAELKTTSNFPVMRVPSRGMSLWNKSPEWKILLHLFSLLDNLTISRKPDLASYFTFCFVLCK